MCLIYIDNTWPITIVNILRQINENIFWMIEHLVSLKELGQKLDNMVYLEN